MRRLDSTEAQGVSAYCGCWCNYCLCDCLDGEFSGEYWEYFDDDMYDDQNQTEPPL